MTKLDLNDAFGDDLSDADMARAADAVNKFSEAIPVLVELMDADDEGGAVRVGYMLVQLGHKLAGTTPPKPPRQRPLLHPAEHERGVLTPDDVTDTLEWGQ